MGNKQFESLIGKDISFAEKFIGDDFVNKLFEKNFYYIIDDSIKKCFYGMSYKTLSIQINEKKKVQSITINFNEVINDKFYNSFILDYGNPDTIQVIDGYDSVGKWTRSDSKEEFNQRVRKVTLKMKEGKFDDNPLFMIWNKKGYQIKAFLRYKQNISEITFRIPTDNF